jgi:hypothetical protein
MMQMPVRNVAVVAVLSTAFLGTLTGCGSGVDSAEYKEILDQPETPVQLSTNATEDSPENTTEPGKTDGATASGRAGVSEQPTGTEFANKVVEPVSAADLQGDTAPTEGPSGSPVPAETAAAETAKDAGTADKPANDSDPSAPEATDPNSSKTEIGAEEKEKQPRIVTLLIPDKKFNAEGKGDEKALRVSFDDFDLLKVLNMEPVTEDAPSRMPKWLKDLDGQRIRVRGFMFPPFEEENIPVFTLARDNQICCFGRNPLVYDLVDVFMRKGETADYIQNRPFDVIGTFHIGDSIVPGELYSMDDAVVIDR